MKEILIKTVLYGVLAVVTLIVAMHTADCDEVTRILYDKGNSAAGQTARFYFLTLMGIGVIIVQNVFIRFALYANGRKSEAALAGTGRRGEQ